MAALLTFLIVLALATAAWRDLAVRRIPNALCATVAVAGVVLRGLGGIEALAQSAAAAAALFIVLFVLFVRGWFGGGDVKLATAVALGLPPSAVWSFVVATALAGGVLSAVYLVAISLRPARLAPRGRAASLPRRVAAAEIWRIGRRGPLPYGIPLCASGVALTATSQLWG